MAILVCTNVCIEPQMASVALAAVAIAIVGVGSAARTNARPACAVRTVARLAPGPAA
jgi:hypothetical protein